MFLTKLMSLLIKLKNNFQINSKKNNFDKYFVKITKIYIDEISDKLMLKYRISTCGISAKIPYSEFIGTPLIYGVHPDQIILLAKEAKRCTIKIKNKHKIQTSV